jgi:predicted Zn-dependent peptidase
MVPASPAGHRRPVTAIAHTVLDNGVRVILAPRPAMPVATVHVRMAVGSRHEPAGRTGLAHLFEHLMFAATRRLPSGDHVRAVEAEGGYTNATTTTDSTSYFATLPPGAAALAVWLEARRLADLLSALDEEVLTAQRAVVANENRQSGDRPYGDAAELLAASMFAPPHPYHHTPAGRPSDVDAASLVDAAAFFQTNYVAERTLVCVAGDIDVDEVGPVVGDHFGQLRRGGGATAAAGSGAAPGPAEHVRLERRSAAPTHLVIGHQVAPAGTTGWDCADLTAVLLATGRASRLQRRLVRELGLAANVRVDLAPMAAGAALLVARLRPAPGVDPRAVERAYLAELRALAEDGPDRDELARARTQWTMRFLTATETGKGLAEYLTLEWLTSDRAPRPDQARARIDQTSTKDIRGGAGALLTARRVTLTYLPE